MTKKFDVPAPFVGQVAQSKGAKVTYKVIHIFTHLNSTDVSYIKIQADSGREKTVHHAEWSTRFVCHSAPPKEG